MVRPCFKWLKRIDIGLEKTDKQLTNKIGNNILIEGLAGSSKDYTLTWIQEYGMVKYGIKPYYLWCENIEHLREVLSIMFKSKIENFEEKYRATPRGFPVLVYVPITQNLPNKLPDFFVPYAVSANSLGEYALKALFGYANYEKYSKVYRKNITKKSSYLDLKWKIKKVRRKEVVEVGFMGEKWLLPEVEKQEAQAFAKNFAIFNKLGGISSGQFEYTLEKQLLPQLNDNRFAVVLFTGFEHNYWIKRFFFIHFAETLKNLIRKQTRMNFRNVIRLNELQDISKADYGKDALQIDNVVNDFIRWILRNGRHFNIDVWGDIKPNAIEKTVKGLFHVRYVTAFSSSDDIKELVAFTPHQGKRISSIFNDPNYRREYGFLDLSQYPIPEWVDRRRRIRQQGCRLPRPKLTQDQDVMISERFWGVFKDRLVDSQVYKRLLVEDWKRTEIPEQERIKQEAERKRAEKEKKSLPFSKKQKAIDMLDMILDTNGLEYVCQHIGELQDQIAKRLGVSRKQVVRYLAEYKQKKGIRYVKPKKDVILPTPM